MTGAEECLIELTAAGALVNKQDIYSHRALFLTVSNGHIDCVKELLGPGAGVNIDGHGWFDCLNACRI